MIKVQVELLNSAHQHRIEDLNTLLYLANILVIHELIGKLGALASDFFHPPEHLSKHHFCFSLGSESIEFVLFSLHSQDLSLYFSALPLSLSLTSIMKPHEAAEGMRMLATQILQRSKTVRLKRNREKGLQAGSEEAGQRWEERESFRKIRKDLVCLTVFSRL